jgi:dTDP-4-dehydrorhamnose 3,5-epimerase
MSPLTYGNLPAVSRNGSVPIYPANRIRNYGFPPGCAHGFYVLSEWADVVYKVTDYYNPETERTLRWNDPDIDIEWPLIEGQKPVLSSKDASGNRLSELPLFE